MQITIPTSDYEGHAPRHIEVQLDLREADILRKITVGLGIRSEMLQNGRPVDSSPQTIRWLLQEMLRAECIERGNSLKSQTKRKKKNPIATKT